MKLTNLRVMLETRDLRETIKFYTELLGFVLDGIYPNNKEPCWACVIKDDIVIMFTTRNAHSTVEDTTMTGTLYFYPNDVDEAWELLKDKAIVEYPIENFGYGMREFAIRDCNGYLLQFGQGISET